MLNESSKNHTRVKRSIQNYHHLTPYQQQLQRHHHHQKQLQQQQHEQYQRERELREREMRERQRSQSNHYNRANANQHRDARQYHAMMQQPPQYNHNVYHYQHHYQNSLYNVQQKNLDENKEHTIEVLVAVDKKMQEYHGKNLKNYVLTLMSVVSK
jgi:hypothetical protein